MGDPVARDMPINGSRKKIKAGTSMSYKLNTDGFSETREDDGALTTKNKEKKEKKEPKVLSDAEYVKYMTRIGQELKKSEKTSRIQYRLADVSDVEKEIADYGDRMIVLVINLDRFKTVSKSGANISHEAIKFRQIGKVTLPETKTRPERVSDNRLEIFLQSDTASICPDLEKEKQSASILTVDTF